MAERSYEEGIHASGSTGARFAAGIAAGIIGGLVMMGFLMVYANARGADLTTPLKDLAAFVYGVESLIEGPTAMVAGALIQLGFSIAIGIAFALFLSRDTSTVTALFAGIL